MSTSLLSLGFVLGLRHALEADHLAAMASILTTINTKKCAARQGIAWGLGHSFTIFLFGLLIINLNINTLGQYSLLLEIIVGVMLIVLGLNVIRQLFQKKTLAHRYESENRGTHIHLHSHTDAVTGKRNANNHNNGFPYNALSVGVMHGLAGTASLLLIVLSSTTSLKSMLITGPDTYWMKV